MILSIDDLLHSDAPLVVIEAAAGCGKTWTAAKFAKEMSARLVHQRVLLLSHTHGACGEFHRRCAGPGLRIDVETCDSFALKVVGPYATALGLPFPLDHLVGRAEVSFEVIRSALRAVGRTDDPRGHLHALSRLRRRRALPPLSTSTVHKAKGLEFRRVLVCPADEQQYPSGSYGARLFYVAISRATHQLTIVTDTGSPLAHLGTGAMGRAARPTTS